MSNKNFGYFVTSLKENEIIKLGPCTIWCSKEKGRIQIKILAPKEVKIIKKLDPEKQNDLQTI